MSDIICLVIMDLKALKTSVMIFFFNILHLILILKDMSFRQIDDWIDRHTC